MKDESFLLQLANCKTLQLGCAAAGFIRLKADFISSLAPAGSGFICGASYSSIFSTAMKASLGTDTVPKVRMRFLPSFCFSSSFFFLVMSPP